MKERILIAGGSGLIGSRLTRELPADRYDVVILSRNPTRVELPPGARAVEWDAETAEGWGELADGAFGIVNLAGEGIADGRWTEEKKRRIRASRIDSSRAVLAAVERAETKPRVVVQGSAVGYYGPAGDRLLTEEAPPGDDFLARVAVEWEAVTAPVEAMGVRRPVVRTGVVLDSEEGALPKMALPFKMFAGGPLGSGRQYVPWIHIADEAAAIRFLLEHGEATGPFNLTAPHPVENRELARALGRVLHRPSLLPTPGPALRLAVGEMAEILLTGQRAIPKRLQELGFSFRFPTLEPALKDLLG